MLKLPEQVLFDIIAENPKIVISKDVRSFMHFNEDGEYICLDPSDLDDESTISHEMGHVVDHVYKKDEYGFSSDNKEFVDSFNKGCRRYEAAGNIRHSEKWDEKHHSYSIVYEKEGDYCTFNQQEMFAECYQYITTGNCSSISTIKKYFPEMLNIVKHYISNIRSGKYGDRNI